MVASAATGTALNAVSAGERVEPEHGGGDCEHRHQTGGRTGKAVLQKAGERVHINGHAGKTRIGMLFMPGSPRRSIWPKLRKRTEC